MTESTKETTVRAQLFRTRRAILWTVALVVYSAVFIRAESGVASFAFFGLWILAVADSLFGLSRRPLWLVALGILAAVFVPGEYVVLWPRGATHGPLVAEVMVGRGGNAVVLLSAWAFAVINHVLGLRKILLWMGVLGVYCTAFVAFAHPMFFVPFALSIVAIAALRSTVAPRLLSLLGMIAGAVLWPILFFAKAYRHAVAGELATGVLLGAALGIGTVAAAEVAGRIVDWADGHLSRGVNRARPGRSGLQFSLTQMLVVVVLLALPLGWLASEFPEKRKYDKVMVWLESLDASYASHSCNWLERLLRVQRVTGIFKLFQNQGLADRHRASQSVVDADLKRLRGLDSLRTLNLPNTRITDAGLAHLQDLTSLDALWLEGTDVSDVGMACLGGLVNLESLNLADTQVTDRGLEHLERLRSLESFCLEGTHVSDAGMISLRALTNLKWLSLTGTNVTPQGVARLQEALPDCHIDNSHQ